MTVLLHVENTQGSRRLVLDRPMVIGRARECDLPVNDRRLSRHHARLEPRGRQVVVTDLGSSNGTSVNGRTVREAVLRSGDRLEVGDTIVRVDLAGGGDAADDDPAATRVVAPPATQLGSQVSMTARAPEPPRASRARAAARAMAQRWPQEVRRFSTGRSFIGRWRRCLLAAWTVSAAATLVIPLLWSAQVASRRADTAAQITAAWLAEEVLQASHAEDLDVRLARVASTQPIAQIRLLDSECTLVTTATFDDDGALATPCIDGRPTAPAGTTAGIGLGVARLRKAGLGNAAWVTATVRVSSLPEPPLVGATAVVFVIIAVGVWWATGVVLANIVAPVALLSEAADAALQEGRTQVECPQDWPALTHLAGVVTYLLSRPVGTVAARPGEIPTTPSMTPAPSRQDGTAPASVSAPAPCPSASAPRIHRVQLRLSDVFAVLACDGDPTTLGLAPARVADHVLAILQPNRAIADAALSMLCRIGRDEGPFEVTSTSTVPHGCGVRISLAREASGYLLTFATANDGGPDAS